jgi:hypothetical protein
MKKDIPELIVEGVAIAAVKELNDQQEEEWNVYLINLKENNLEGVLVASTGYGELGEEKRKTSTLRHFLDQVPAKSFSKIEPIVEDVFGLTNEYWVSFFSDQKLFDKKYIFLPETLKEDYFTMVPILNKRGVMIV